MASIFPLLLFVGSPKWSTSNGRGAVVNEYLVITFLLVHFASYELVAWRANSRLKDKRSPERISMFFVGPRSLSNLWQLLFGMSFVRSADRVLIAAGVVHVITTAVVVVVLAGWLARDVLG